MPAGGLSIPLKVVPRGAAQALKCRSRVSANDPLAIHSVYCGRPDHCLDGSMNANCTTKPRMMLYKKDDR